MNNSEKAEILLHEYETLRTEILMCIKHRFQFITIFVVLGTYVFQATQESALSKWAPVIFAAVAMIVVWFWIGYNIYLISCQLSRIEKKIGQLSGDENLLSWESEQGKHGVLHHIYSWPMGHK